MNILEIGAGFGSMFSILKKYGERIEAIEPFSKAKIYLLKKGYKKVYEIKLEESEKIIKTKYDLIGIFDVLEHIEDDRKAIVMMNNLLKDKGALALTVPAYNWLYSYHDRTAMHIRRYTLKELKIKLEESGFKILKASYWNTLLFPLGVIRRKIIPLFKKPDVSDSDFDPKHWIMNNKIVNSFLERALYIESFLLKKATLPYGMSIIILAMKIKEQ